jgi:hypothetical protein
VPIGAMMARAAVLLALGAAPLAAQRPIKVFISVDMEGIGGVVTSEQLGPSGVEYARCRGFLAAEALPSSWWPMRTATCRTCSSNGFRRR